MSVNGEETTVSAREYTRESLGDGEEEEEEKEEKRTRGRERGRAMDKWPSRQTRDRSERARPVTCQSANSCWARRESERTRCRPRNGRVPDEEREGKREKKSYEPRGRGRTRSMCVQSA